MAKVVKLFEFLGVVVARGYIPVEIVLVKNFLDIVILDKCKFFGIKGSDVLGWQVMLKGTFLTDGKQQLHKRFVNVVGVALFRLGPQDAFKVAYFVLEKFCSFACCIVFCDFKKVRKKRKDNLASFLVTSVWPSTLLWF